MLKKIAKTLNEIATKLDADGQYALADKITNTMVRLCQFDPMSAGQEWYRKMYSNPQTLQNPNAFMQQPNMPYRNPNDWKKFVHISPYLKDMDYSNIEGTDMGKNMPYYQSDKFQYDMMNPAMSPQERQQAYEQMNSGNNMDDPYDIYNSFVNTYQKGYNINNPMGQNMWGVKRPTQQQLNTVSSPYGNMGFV